MRDLRVQDHIAMPAGAEAARHTLGAAAAGAEDMGIDAAAAAVGGHHGCAQGVVMVNTVVLIM